MGIWVASTTNQLFIIGSQTETKFSKKKSSYWQNSVFCEKKRRIKNISKTSEAANQLFLH